MLIPFYISVHFLPMYFVHSVILTPAIPFHTDQNDFNLKLFLNFFRMVSNYVTQKQESHTTNMPSKRPLSDFDVGVIHDTGGNSIKRPRNLETPIIQSEIGVPSDSTGPPQFDLLSSRSCSGRDPSRQRSGTSYESPLSSLPFPDPLVHNTHNRASTLGSPYQPTETSLESSHQDESRLLEIDTCFGMVGH